LPNYTRQTSKEQGLSQKPPNGLKTESVDRERRRDDYQSSVINGYNTDNSQNDANDSERVCLQNVGVIFSGGSDVSYV
jgi:hypothetical protein